MTLEEKLYEIKSIERDEFLNEHFAGLLRENGSLKENRGVFR